MVTCLICSQEMNVITWKHLAFHDTTVQQYKQLYPNSPMRSAEATARKKAGAVKANVDRVGVKRDASIIEKIKQTKQLNPREAWNKGVPKTVEQKQQLSLIKKEMYATGTIEHWNVGNITPIHTKQKISNTLKQQHRTYAESSKIKRTATMKTKKANGWVKTTNFKPSQQHREAQSARSKLRNQVKIEQAIQAATVVCTSNNISVISVEHDSYLYTLQCDQCNYQYTRTRNAFVASKLVQESYKCPQCYPRDTGTSKGERELIEFIRTVYSGTVVCNDRTVLQGLELDCLLPDLNLAVEYNGLYWHSERSNGVDSKYHNWKTKFAYTKGIRLITIFEDEWLQKQDIVKSRLVHLLNVGNRSVIYARKTQIKPIDNSTKKHFLSTYHLQGDDVSGIRYGAFYNDVLIAVMTFTKTNMVKGGDGLQYELNRFAVASAVHAPGIASKMFATFVREYNPDCVISYADRRWCTGQVYKQLAFKFVTTTTPSYWYVTDNYSSRSHRSQFMKHMLSSKLTTFDPNLTEWQNMQNNGYDRIWDCGTNKFQWG